MSETLTKWVQENFMEEAQKALSGQQKYWLAMGYQRFYVKPTVWLHSGPKRRLQHFEAFLDFIPSSHEKYQKPSNAGLKKKPCQKRRADLPEPAMFQELLADEPVKNTVTPLKLRRTDSQSFKWKVSAKTQHQAVDVFDPLRVNNNLYLLGHRNDKAMFPLSVKSCEACKVAFKMVDAIAVKTTSVREFTNNGKKQRQSGDIYLHYLKDCLKGHNQNFEFSAIMVLNQAKKLLTDAQVAKLLSTSCHFQDL